MQKSFTQYIYYSCQNSTTNSGFLPESLKYKKREMLNAVKHFCQELKNWKTFLKSLGNKKGVDLSRQMFEIGQLEILKPQKRDKSVTAKTWYKPKLDNNLFFYIFFYKII